jgi:hypothetical protein
MVFLGRWFHFHADHLAVQANSFAQKWSIHHRRSSFLDSKKGCCKMDAFYNCGELGCNKKYKTPGGFTEHMQKVHGKAEAVLPAAAPLAKRQSPKHAEAQRKQAIESELQALQAQCLKRVTEATNDECCLCMEAPRDSLVAPCGHKFFCNPCITAYWAANPHKGCPVCRTPIVLVTRVFG